ncbi:MAG: TrmH family RNA methyltransferase [Thermoleophilia bacterium]
MIREISGRQNDSIKLAHKLQKKKHRRDKGLFVCEGLDLLEAAVEAGELPVEILVREDLLNRLPAEVLVEAEEDELDIGVCSAEVLAHASSLGGAADVVAMFDTVEWSLGDVALGDGISVYVAGVGDPGNVGTLVRSAVAFGAVGVICSPGTADPFGPKALRAGMGAQFLIRIVLEVTPADMAAKVGAEERRGTQTPVFVMADPDGDEEAAGLVVEGPAVVVLGAERGSLPEVGPVVRRVVIRQAAFDSLNVAMAGTVLLYELTRSHLGKGREGLLA